MFSWMCQSKLTEAMWKKWIMALTETPNLFQFHTHFSRFFGIDFDIVSRFYYFFRVMPEKPGREKQRNPVNLLRQKLCVNNYEIIKNDLFCWWRRSFFYVVSFCVGAMAKPGKLHQRGTKIIFTCWKIVTTFVACLRAENWQNVSRTEAHRQNVRYTCKHVYPSNGKVFKLCLKINSNEQWLVSVCESKCYERSWLTRACDVICVSSATKNCRNQLNFKSLPSQTEKGRVAARGGIVLMSSRLMRRLISLCVRWHWSVRLAMLFLHAVAVNQK